MKISLIDGDISATSLTLPLFASRVAAGFPSPADDYVEERIDLNRHIVKRPAATFFARANGDSMIRKGIFNGDLLVIDRSCTPVHGSVVVAALNGEMVCKLLDLQQRCLVSANQRYAPIPINDAMDCVIEGVVTHCIRYLHVRTG
ncbi:MAG: translesion error-prone DNA polymerase V autoproteolytic subunit [Pseudomonadales bacterium]|nr:translesion error-prone DNA polymerase V autoproteolytic subunit [Pseudomonadales bacterium]